MHQNGWQKVGEGKVQVTRIGSQEKDNQSQRVIVHSGMERMECRCGQGGREGETEFFLGGRMGMPFNCRKLEHWTAGWILTRVLMDNTLRTPLMFFTNCKSGCKFLPLGCFSAVPPPGTASLSHSNSA